MEKIGRFNPDVPLGEEEEAINGWNELEKLDPIVVSKESLENKQEQYDVIPPVASKFKYEQTKESLEKKKKDDVFYGTLTGAIAGSFLLSPITFTGASLISPIVGGALVGAVVRRKIRESQK